MPNGKWKPEQARDSLACLGKEDVASEFVEGCGGRTAARGPCYRYSPVSPPARRHLYYLLVNLDYCYHFLLWWTLLLLMCLNMLMHFEV